MACSLARGAIRTLCFALATCVLTCLFTAPALAAPKPGYQPKVAVSAATRLDWIFAMANQSLAVPPQKWLDDGGLKDYDSRQTTYELFVPAKLAKPAPVIVFISASDAASGWKTWQQVCEQKGVIFAGPHGAGNNCPGPKRVRIVLDVLDDIRRQFPTDPDRTYLSGFSGGARIACQIGFALPEVIGGVAPICAGGELRPEPWLRLRSIERTSVALITGKSDFNRGEVERLRGPMLTEVGVRTRVWVFDMGHSTPPPKELQQVFAWLEEAAPARKKLGEQWPASRLAGDAAPDRAAAATALLNEAQKRLQQREHEYQGLMQLMGLRVRWADLPPARTALDTLTVFDSKPDKPWEADDVALTRKFLLAEARGLTAYATGDLPKEYAGQRPDMARGAIERWKLLVADGSSPEVTAEAEKKIAELEPLAK